MQVADTLIICRTFAAVGVDPVIMGIGPSVAIPAALDMAGLQTDDIDLFELNEAFASQVTIAISKEQNVRPSQI